MIATYIIDDEVHAVATLSSYVSRTPGLHLSGSATDAAAGLHQIQGATAPDLLFLDIDMPEINGLEIARLLGGRVPIIFTTSYWEYGVEAFEVQAIDYLLKPFSYARFLEAIQKTQQQMQRTRPLADQLFVKTGIKGQLEKVVLSELIYAESMENYVLLHSRSGARMVHVPLSELADDLRERGFVRVHKSFLVNISFIDRIEPGQLKLANQVTVPIGRAYREAFQQRFKELTLRP
jgi:two-component system LytT family response regulator